MDVTGIGIVSQGVQHALDFKEALRVGRGSFSTHSRFDHLGFSVVASLLDAFNFEERLHAFTELPGELIAHASKICRRAPLPLQASVIVALEAWQSAHLHERKVDPYRIGIVVAGHNLNLAYHYKMHSGTILPSYALHFMDSDHIGTLSELFGIKGESFTAGAASASGNVALIQARRLIQSGSVDACLVVGPIADLSAQELQGFYGIGALGGERYKNDPNRASRPFDRARDGFIWGQIAGALILEKGAAHPAFGRIIGSGFVLDSNRLSDPNAAGEALSMQKAIEDASCKSSDISYINTHGSGSIVGDETELQGIKMLFKEHASNICLNSTKCITGHGLWSSGIVEAIATLIQMNEGFLHPNINLDSPIDENMQFVGKVSQLQDIPIGLSNSFGFGGINSSIVLARGERRL